MRSHAEVRRTRRPAAHRRDDPKVMRRRPEEMKTDGIDVPLGPIRRWFAQTADAGESPRRRSEKRDISAPTTTRETAAPRTPRCIALDCRPSERRRQ